MCKTGHNHLWDSRVNLFQNVRLDHDAAAENYAGRVKNMDQGCKTKHDLINPFIYDCFNFRAFQIGENLAAVGKRRVYSGNHFYQGSSGSVTFITSVKRVCTGELFFCVCDDGTKFSC